MNDDHCSYSLTIHVCLNVHSLPSEGGARGDSVISPLIVEAILRQSPPPIAGGPSAEEDNTTVLPSSSPRSTPDRDHGFAEETNHLPSTTEEHLVTGRLQSASRASPLGSVLDAVTVPLSSEPDVLLGDHDATTPPQRHSPAGSVHSSSLFSSGLPSPIMSPRGRSQSDTGVPLVSRGSPPGSLHTLPLRPQSLGGSVPSATGLLTTRRSPSAPIATGAEMSPVSPIERQSPTGSNHSSSVRPQGGVEIVDLLQQEDDSRHSSQRSTPVVSALLGSGAASPRVALSANSQPRHQTSEHSSPRLRTSDVGSSTELLMETAYRQATPPAPSRTETTSPTPPVLPGHRVSEHYTPIANSPRNRPFASRSPTELLTETTYRHGVVVSPLVPSTDSRLHHHDSGNSTPLVNSPRHTSGAQSPSELLVETSHTAVSSRTAMSPMLPSRGSKISHQERGNGTSLPQSPRHRVSGTGMPSETPSVPTQGDPSRGSKGQSPASSSHTHSEHSPARVFSPPLSRESVIPSHSSAFAAVTGDHGSYSRSLPSEAEVLRQERDSLARELRQRTAHYEAELKRFKSRNEDLEQQMLSIEVIEQQLNHSFL